MNLAINELTDVSDLKEFTRRTKEIEKGQPDSLDWMIQLDAATALRLYDPFYTKAPCPSFAVKASAAASCFVPDSFRWRLFVRQAWAVAKERQRTPFPVSSLPSEENGTVEQRFDHFRKAYQEHDFKSAFAVVKGFLSGASDREFFRERSLALALADSAYFGFKAVFLQLAWNLAERGEWRWAIDCLFPAFHFLVVGDHQSSELGQSPVRAGREDKPVSVEGYREAETALLHGSRDQASAAIERMATAGLGTNQIYEALLLACAQAVINSNGAKWEVPVRAFQVISLCQDLDSKASDSPRNLRTAALHLNRAARASTETEGNRTVDDVVSRLCPTDPVGVLRSVISHTDPHAAATALLAGLGMPEDKRGELFHALWQQTIKNDAACTCSQDVLYVGQAMQHWRACPWPNRDLLVASAAYLVGRLPKNYQLAAEYGI